MNEGIKQKQAPSFVIPAILLAILIALSLPIFANRVYQCLSHPELQNTTDMDIFAGAAKRFLATGQLYQRSDNYTETYAPGAGVYKFPPAYQLTILPLLKTGLDDFHFLLAERILQLLAYLGTGLALIMVLAKQHLPNLRQRYNYYAITLLLLLWCNGFFESFIGVEPEIFIFFLLGTALLLFNRMPVASGAMLAIATCMKVYPVLLALVFIYARNWRALGGFVLGLFLTTVLAIFCIGSAEHVFYLTSVVPVLLREHPIAHVQNTTIEALFYLHDDITAMHGVITAGVKFITLAAIAYVMLKTKAHTAKHSSVFFSMLVAALLLCLPNYWPQYQVVLMVPMLVLLAHVSTMHLRNLYAVLIVIAIAMAIQEGWYQDMRVALMSYETPASLDTIVAFMHRHPAADPLLFYFPVTVFFSWWRDLMFLVPAILFFASARILLTEKQQQLAR